MPARMPVPVGQQFAYLTALGPASAPVSGKTTWSFRCVCGVVKDINAQNVRSGSVKSCGCKRYMPGHTNATHGMHHTRTYAIWGAMKTRCTNPNAEGFHRYGGRGIAVCDRWMNSFENFLADMGEAPAGLSIDRFPDKDGNYEPGNCRWATNEEQALNTSQNRHETAFGETKTVTEWARDPRCRVNLHTVWARLRLGWPIERAISKPARPPGWNLTRAGRAEVGNAA